MNKKFKSVAIAALVSLTLACFACLGIGTAKEVDASSALDGRVYNNLITNGDFEKSYDQWGVNGRTPEAVQEDDGNTVGKITEPGFVQARIWNAPFMYDQLYRISFRLKFETTEATGSAQFLARIKGNDGAFGGEQYVNINLDGNLAVNEWVARTFYLKIADYKDGTYTILTGSAATALTNVYGEQTFATELNFFDVAVGNGHMQNLTAWYIDDFEMIPYAEYAINLIENGDFQTEYTSWGINSNFVPEATTLEDGNVVGKITAPGWLSARLWNASYIYGKTYRVSVNYKPVTSDGSTTTNQFLALIKSNDGGHLADTYVTFGGEAGLTSGEWKTFAWYFKLVQESDKDVLYTGATPDGMAFKQEGSKGALSYFDFAIGCGALGNVTEYYVDDYAIVEYNEKEVTSNSGMTDVFPSNGWGVNSWPVPERVWDNAKESYVAKLSGGGWLQTRLWKAYAKLDTLYRINLQLKQTNPNATADGQFLIQAKVNDGAVGYIDIGCNADGYTNTNVYNSYVAYAKLVSNADGTVSLYGGKTKGQMAKVLDLGAYADFSHLDIAIGCGAPGSTTDWFVDNFTVIDVSPEVPEVREYYNAYITVKDGEGTALADYEYTVVGSYESAEENGNVITITNAEGELTVLVSKSGYKAKEVTLSKDNADVEAVLERRTITPDESNYKGELFPYGSFEGLTLGTTTNYFGDDVLGVATFVNGPASYMTVTNEDSYYGEKSLKAYTDGDRMVFRLTGGNKGYQIVYQGITYHGVFYVKGTAEDQTIQPCVYITYYVEGDTVTSGANQAIPTTLNIGDKITLSTETWTRIELSIKYEIVDGKLVVTTNGEPTTYESSVEGKKIIEACWFDLSLSTKKEFFIDDVAFFKDYDAEVEVLTPDGDKVTENVTWQIKDYQNRTLDVTPILTEKGTYAFGGLYGTVKFTATVGDKTYTGTTLDAYNKLTLADAYTATVKVADYSGKYLTNQDITKVYALDGANVIAGVYDSATGTYSFENCMGELKLYVFAKGYVQHYAYSVTRKERNKTIALEKVASSLDGLEGNIAMNGDPEELSQLEMYNNQDYALEGIKATGTNDRWASFGPILTLSDEALVGEKALRISTNTMSLKADDPAYAEFMEENDLPDATFGDRVSYRAGNGFLLDGTVYRYSAYVKAPASQEGNTVFDFIGLTSVNICNGGQFNLWAPSSLSVSNEYWSNIEVFFSYNVVIDEAAEAGNYEFARYKLVYTFKGYLNGELFSDVHGEYGYTQYKDGTAAFYQPMADGTMYTFGGVDTERHDGTVKNQEGGRSFGSIAYVEPSIQITNNKSLLVDGLTITRAYTASVTVLKKDVSVDDTVKYLKLTDRYTGKVTYLEASEYYDNIDRKYYIPSLFNSYEVTAVDENKQEFEGLRAQIISSEKSDVVVEYDYSIKITVKDQFGELVTDVVIRIVLANGSTVEAVNNNDGTYTYEGLSGIRTINFRKVTGSENSYTFPTGLTVSSKNNEFEVTVTKKTNNDSSSGSSDPSSSEEDPEYGCIGSVSTATTGVIVLIGFAFATIRKKKEN